MPIWRVKATWTEDEAEASEQWEVNAATAHEAVEEAMRHIRFLPHHVEARLCTPGLEEASSKVDLPRGQGRRNFPL
jgi:hypothetical protein